MHRWDEIWRDIHAKFHPRNRWNVSPLWDEKKSKSPRSHRTNNAVVLAARNAASDNGRAAHTGWLKLQDGTLTDDFAGVDISGLDNGGPDIDGRIPLASKVKQ